MRGAAHDTQHAACAKKQIPSCAAHCMQTARRRQADSTSYSTHTQTSPFWTSHKAHIVTLTHSTKHTACTWHTNNGVLPSPTQHPAWRQRKSTERRAQPAAITQQSSLASHIAHSTQHTTNRQQRHHHRQHPLQWTSTTHTSQSIQHPHGTRTMGHSPLSRSTRHADSEKAQSA